MRQLGNFLDFIGKALFAIGALLFAGIFLVVLINGKWPLFLEPVRSRFSLASDFLGPFTFIVEAIIFVGPGLLLRWIGQRILQEHR
jgi:hypothetical protein